MHAPVTPRSDVRKIKRVFIANRGEIAVRVVRACHALGIEAVVAVSDVDAATLAAKLADRAVVIGSAAPADSYLNIEKLIAAAIENGCEAVHPGYGFLSERSAFSRACIDAGLIFIGPSPEAIDSMGDKISAVKLAEQAGVPRVPGSAGLIDADDARRVAKEIGYPILVKATAGGGGRGMRIVRQEADLDASMKSAANEAQAAFGDPTLYIEKFIEHARHIEIQVMGDAHGNMVSLGERECSTQRRHQKLIEEAPSPIVDPALRARMGDCAVRLARRVNYVGAGTVEFILDPRDNRFYFLEMNTRIQVEHPVTEMIMGIDLVAEQIRVASGEPLSFSHESLEIRGHSIECRINAEDFNRNFLPKPGLIATWEEPSGEGVRVDTHCYAGYTVPPNYDSLLAKLIVHADTREQAIARMREALTSFTIGGPPSTVAFHLEVMNNDDFVHGRVTTQWVEQHFLPQRKAVQRKASAS
jgi:acetyl-CoA carboxylase biotin carboxylase subunit